MNDIDRAERIQSMRAYLIPSSMFVACLINSAGIYILYTGNSAGVIFLVAGFGIIVWALVSFIQFQNKLRAKGQFKQHEDELEGTSFDTTADKESAQEKAPSLTAP